MKKPTKYKSWYPFAVFIFMAFMYIILGLFYFIFKP